jgi:hypothetical protein
MEHLSQSSPNSAFLFPTSVTLRSAMDVRAALLTLLQSGAPITLDCTEMTEADLSLVQLVVAFRKSVVERGMTVALKEPASGALLQLLVRSGFLTAPAGNPDFDDAFWLKGTSHHE